MSTAVQPQLQMQSSGKKLTSYWPLLLAVILLYGKTIVELAKDWWDNPDYSHGLLVPFAVGYLLWEKRDKLTGMVPKPSVTGLFIVLISQLFFLVGVLGSEYFVQRSSFLLMLAGCIVFLFGWAYLWECFFGLVLLQLSIPLPALIFNSIALPLQLFASAWAESALQLCRIPVYREGNILQLSTQSLNVTEACSGIRSLVSLITLATMLAYILPVKWFARIILVISAFPIALGANALRVAGTGILARYFGERAAQGFFHTFEGWIVFLLAFGAMAIESTLLQRWFGTLPKENKA